MIHYKIKNKLNDHWIRNIKTKTPVSKYFDNEFKMIFQSSFISYVQNILMAKNAQFYIDNPGFKTNKSILRKLDSLNLFQKSGLSGVKEIMDIFRCSILIKQAFEIEQVLSIVLSDMKSWEFENKLSDLGFYYINIIIPFSFRGISFPCQIRLLPENLRIVQTEILDKIYHKVRIQSHSNPNFEKMEFLESLHKHICILEIRKLIEKDPAWIPYIFGAFSQSNFESNISQNLSKKWHNTSYDEILRTIN